MIKSFKDKATEMIYHRGHSVKLPHNIQRLAMRKLWMLDAAPDLEVLKVPPGNQLEKLRGDREGKYSIRVNAQWRICFRWENGDSHEVEIVDYH